MLWSDDPLPYPFRPLPTSAVRLYFESAPNFHLIVDAPGLRAELRALGKKRISVQFKVWRRLSGGSKIFDVIAIEGRALPGTVKGYKEGVEVSPRELDPFSGLCE